MPELLHAGIIHTWGRCVPGLVNPHGGTLDAWVGRCLVGACMPGVARAWGGACMHCMSETVRANPWLLHPQGGACMPGVVRVMAGASLVWYVLGC